MATADGPHAHALGGWVGGCTSSATRAATWRSASAMGCSCQGGSYASVLWSGILLAKSMERVGRQLPLVLCCLQVPRHHGVR